MSTASASKAKIIDNQFNIFTEHVWLENCVN